MDRVRETLSKIWNSLKERWLALSKTVRIVIVAVLAAVVAAIVILVIINSQTGYRTIYTDVDATELSTMTGIIRNDLLVTDVKISGNSIMVPEESADTVIMEMAILGYPKTTFNFDLWKESVGMFSTESDKKEILRQQLTYNLMSVLGKFPKVESANVIITPESEQPYVLADQKTDASVAVYLTLRPDQKLTSKEIEGVYFLVLRSVPGLDRENITVTDGSGNMLIADEGPSELEELAILREKLNMQIELQNQMSEMYTEGLRSLLIDTSTQFNVLVNVALDFGNETVEEVIYTPSVDDEGNRGGMVSAEVEQEAWGGVLGEGGLVGTTTDADISPDYPTLVADGESDAYFERLRQIDYNVNTLKRHYENTANVTIKHISASVVVDEAQMTDEELRDWEIVVANGIGATADNVSVKAKPFVLKQSLPNAELNIGTSQNRNLLIFIIIALGAVLIILLLLAIMTSGSKKRRQVRARMRAATITPTGTPGYDDETFGSVTAVRMGDDGEPIESTGGIDSLLDDEDSREGALRSEIREFSRQNPDIVAQLIRTWMKE